MRALLAILVLATIRPADAQTLVNALYDGQTVVTPWHRNRQAGMLRGAAILAGIGAIFGGIDLARNKIGPAEFAGTLIGNAIPGAMLGYFIAPRKRQRLPY